MLKPCLDDFHSGSSDAALIRLQEALSPQYAILEKHEMYSRLTSLADMRVFMEHHVFAVWDFMSLLKTMQSHLTCTDAMWHPVGDAASRRLINQMVLEEESDEIDGVPVSHFEVYLSAMREIGADMASVTKFVDQVLAERDIEAAFVRASVPSAARNFVHSTFEIIGSGKAHVVCAAFTFGREQAVPGIFKAVMDSMPDAKQKLRRLSVYLERHIELDGGEHGPMALRMLSALCGTDTRKWQEATMAAQFALNARIAFWSGISRAIAERALAERAMERAIGDQAAPSKVAA